MAKGTKRLADRISEPAYLSDLEKLSAPELKTCRREVGELEAELSYARRLLQGKIDILRHELIRRREGGGADVDTLISSLPAILADTGRSGIGRHVDIAVPPGADRRRREVEKLVSDATLTDLSSLSVEELAALLDQLVQAEVSASEERRVALSVLDRLEEETVRRYRDGIQDVSALLGTDS